MRRGSVRVWLVALAVAMGGAGLVPAHAGGERFAEGIEFERIQSNYRPDTPDGNVEVIEFFWYGCPHCNRFEPYLEQWLADKPDYVTFRRVAAPLNPRWTVHAKAFYAARELGVADKAHADLFSAIHDQGRHLNSAEALATFYSQYGVDKADFIDMMRSFQVDRRLREALSTARKLGVRSVPTVVIAGRYRTDATSAGSFAKVLEVIDFLIGQVRGKAHG